MLSLVEERNILMMGMPSAGHRSRKGAGGDLDTARRTTRNWRKESAGWSSRPTPSARTPADWVKRSGPMAPCAPNRDGHRLVDTLRSAAKPPVDRCRHLAHHERTATFSPETGRSPMPPSWSVTPRGIGKWRSVRGRA